MQNTKSLGRVLWKTRQKNILVLCHSKLMFKRVLGGNLLSQFWDQDLSRTRAAAVSLFIVYGAMRIIINNIILGEENRFFKIYFSTVPIIIVSFHGIYVLRHNYIVT